MFFFFDEAQKRRGAPPIGTMLYVVREHLYYTDGRASPLLEYVVCAGELRRLIEGKRVSMELVLKNAGSTNLAYPRVGDIGKTAFYTAQEAAALAKQMTEDYEKRWSWTARWGDVPLRRPWEELLKEGTA